LRGLYDDKKKTENTIFTNYNKLFSFPRDFLLYVAIYNYCWFNARNNLRQFSSFYTTIRIRLISWPGFLFILGKVINIAEGKLE